MIKRLVTTAALLVSLATVQPTWANEFKKYDELTQVQKDLFSARAMVVADPQFAGAVFYEQFDGVARDSDPKQNTRWYHVFAECASGMLIEYYQNISVIDAMYWTDDEITAHMGNYSFDIGALCAYEAHEDQKSTRWN